MHIVNNSGMITGYTMGMESSGRESIVLVIKGTFNIPLKSSEKPHLVDEQVPLIEADVFSGEPGLSSPLFEVDYAPTKHKCDITLIGSAYAPGGRPEKIVQAGFKVGGLSKVLNVYGDRYWETGSAGFVPSPAKPFTKRQITYDIAFGGVDRFHDDDAKHDPYLLNPIGLGYHCELSHMLINTTPAPCTEECDNPVRRPDGQYKPMSFGPLGRAWLPRSLYGGTYDEQWLADHFPFLPPDFDERYYQSAPEDQQTTYLSGGERVSLLNVTEDGKRVFELPTINIPVTFFKKKSRREEKLAVLDTLVLDPDNARFTLTWRASIKLNNDMHEVPEALVGRASRGWWRAKETGKAYYPDIDALIKGQRIETLEDDT